jgi:diguanylate cyclase
MFMDFLHNLAITSAVLFLAGKFFEHRTLDFNAPLKTKLYCGIWAGLAGILFMLSTIHVTGKVLVDLRHLPIIIAAIYGGPIAAIVSAIIIGMIRIIMFGYSIASLGGSLVAVTTGLFCAYLSRTKLPLVHKFIWMNTFSVGVASLAIFLLVDNLVKVKKIFFYYWPISFLAAIFTFIVSEYIKKSNENSRFLKQNNLFLEQLSNRDGLTQIYNRRFFDTTIEKEWKRASRNCTSLSLILFDIDNFKKYNDTYGHQVGDECLQKIAKLAETLIQSPSDVVARYGGEEFAIILPETTEDGALKIAETIRKAIQSLSIPNIYSNVLPIVTISTGVASLNPNPESNQLQLIERADQALYQAKSEGRNRVELYKGAFT